MHTPELVESRSVDSGGLPLHPGGFSPVLGGPLYRLYLRTRMARPPLELLWRRIAGLTLLCWLPPFVMAALAGRLFGGVSIPFLVDTDAQVKLLAAIPLLLAAETFAQRRIPEIVEQFPDRGIVAGQVKSDFIDRLRSAVLLRNSALVELCLLLLAAIAGHWTWRRNLPVGISAWYGTRVDGHTLLSAAGQWYAFVSLPVLRFLLLRWYFRIFVWYRLLWQVRALPLRLNLFHPDRAAGLGFLAESAFAIAPVLATQAMMFAGLLAGRIAHGSATLPDFKLELACVVCFLVAVALVPQCFFVPQLFDARLNARQEFGTLASHYVDSFRLKWIQRRDQNERSEPLLGSADIQSLADMGNAFGTVNEMRVFPVSAKSILHLVIFIAAPLTPLLLTMMRIDQALNALLKLLL